jgi:hypothetical protein
MSNDESKTCLLKLRSMAFVFIQFKDFSQLWNEQCNFTHLKVKEPWQNRIGEAVLRLQ